MRDQFDHWVTAYQSDVLTLARYLMKNLAEAEDVTQESFTKLWEARHKPPVAVRPWLLRTTRNACLDRLRRQSIVEINHGNVEVNALVDPTPDAETQLSNSRAVAELRDAIEALDEPFRSLVVLRDLQGRSYEELHLITELTTAQVKVYLHRARKQLTGRLAHLKFSPHPAQDVDNS